MATGPAQPGLLDDLFVDASPPRTQAARRPRPQPGLLDDLMEPVATPRPKPTRPAPPNQPQPRRPVARYHPDLPPGHKLLYTPQGPMVRRPDFSLVAPQVLRAEQARARQERYDPETDPFVQGLRQAQPGLRPEVSQFDKPAPGAWPGAKETFLQQFWREARPVRREVAQATKPLQAAGLMVLQGLAMPITATQAALEPLVRPETAKQSYFERGYRNMWEGPQVSKALLETAGPDLGSQVQATLAASIMDSLDIVSPAALARFGLRGLRNQALRHLQPSVPTREAAAMARAAEQQAVADTMTAAQQAGIRPSARQVTDPALQARVRRVAQQRAEPDRLAGLARQEQELAEARTAAEAARREASRLRTQAELVQRRLNAEGPRRLPTAQEAAMARLQAREVAEAEAREAAARARVEELARQTQPQTPTPGLLDDLFEDGAPPKLEVVRQERGPIRDPNAPGVGVMGPQLPPKPTRLRTQEEILAEQRPGYRAAQATAPEATLEREVRERAAREAEAARTAEEARLLEERQREMPLSARQEAAQRVAQLRG
ncbi:MAG: hypothetical protein AB1758_25765, partial [Candidatus Eremiobacterota bacterium]